MVSNNAFPKKRERGTTIRRSTFSPLTHDTGMDKDMADSELLYTADKNDARSCIRINLKVCIWY